MKMKNANTPRRLSAWQASFPNDRILRLTWRFRILEQSGGGIGLPTFRVSKSSRYILTLLESLVDAS